ncbi:MAG: MFS transporter [Clostridia bacterium]|nr:MFS transporter [Clostridia bacterium]
MNKIYQNIKKEYLFQFIRNTSLSEGVWMLFLAARGMSLVQIGLLESVFHITGMLMEVPTGFIADRYGRRFSRVLGRVMGFLSCIIMLSSHSFWLFALGFVFTGLSYNLESGAGDALIYDTLTECGKQEEYMKVKGRNEVCFQLARLVSLVAGGAVATISYDLAYILTLFIHLAAFGISLTFTEPNVMKAAKPDSLIQHMGESLKAVWNNRGVLPLVLHLEVFSLLYTTLYFYFQNFMKSQGYIEYQIGLILAATSVLGVIVSASAYKVENRLGDRKVVLLTGILPGLLFLAVAFTRAEPLALIILASVEGFMFVVFGDYINKRIPSEHRATLLSFEAMIFSVMMIVFFPLVGFLSQHYGFKLAFGVIAALSLISGGATTVFVLKSNLRKAQQESTNQA